MNPETRKNQDFYESFAVFYPRIFEFLDAPATVEQWVSLVEIEGLVPLPAKRRDSPPHLLDAGCGPGLFLAAWAEAGFEVSGLDVSPTMLRLAAEELRRHHLGPQCALHEGNLCEPDTLAALSESFDLVVSHSHIPNLIHPDDLPALFRSVAAVLKQGGVWAVDHSRIVSTLPVGQEEHEISPSEHLIRTSDYDAENRLCIQSWVGSSFSARETYWFPELDVLDRLGRQSGLKLEKRLEWTPNRVSRPFTLLLPSSERLLSLYRRG